MSRLVIGRESKRRRILYSRIRMKFLRPLFLKFTSRQLRYVITESADDTVLTAENFSQFYEAGTFMELRADFLGRLGF